MSRPALNPLSYRAKIGRAIALPCVGGSVSVGVGVSKMLKFYVNVFSSNVHGALSCMRTGLFVCSFFSFGFEGGIWDLIVY